MAGDVALVPAISRPVAVIAPPLSQPAASTRAADPASAAASSKRPLIDPSPHVDLALNLVVLEFINDKGAVTNTIPSEKQLKAYRENAAGAGSVVGLSVQRGVGP